MKAGEKKKVLVLGSTGSVGRQALEVIRERGYTLTGICADSNIKLLEEQIRSFSPQFCAVRNRQRAKELAVAVQDTKTKILAGEEGILALCRECPADIAENSLLGSAGILPTLELIRRGVNIAMANKEPIVAAGEIILKAASEKNVHILPVDSEHSAIFQCLSGSFNSRKFVQELVLTASGGPFYGKDRTFLKDVTPEMAVAHPVWHMGKKISVDSATLLNKGLELIEAHRLFSVAADDICITVHRQSIVHSMVTFVDGSTLAQMGHPDMRHCIQFALTWPDRTEGLCRKLDFSNPFTLTFEPADEKTFTLLSTAREAARRGGTFTTVLNAANEAAVSLFLNGKIGFTDIFSIVENAVNSHSGRSVSDAEEILSIDFETKTHILEQY